MKKVGILGYGNMGQAIAKSLKPKYEVLVFDKDNTKTSQAEGLKVAKLAGDLAGDADIVILAVKPQDFEEALTGIKKYCEGKLVISIAAGITCSYIERILGKVRVVRAMPNIGAKIGRSVTCICKGSLATRVDQDDAKEIFKNIGEVQELGEDMMNAATAISGSGPGYYFHAVETNPEKYKTAHKKFHDDFVGLLSEAALEAGFDEKTAKFLSHWTIVYSDLLLKETGLSAQELKKQVTSKGGTTEAALEVLHKGGSLVDAVKAAVNRAKQLSRG